MLFMNEQEINDAVRRYYPEHPVLGPAAVTLYRLMSWANRNSDGWCYWPKPCRAARQLQELIQQHEWWARYTYPSGGTSRPDLPQQEATYELLKRAYKPLKAFRTRMVAQGIADSSNPDKWFTIEE